MKAKPKVGDIFSIPLDDARCAYGQVFLKDHATFPLYVAIFRPAFPSADVPDLDAICLSEIALVGATADARIYHGIWLIVGNRAPGLSRLPRPYFKVERDGAAVIEDFDGTVLRAATPEDVRKYDNRWSRAPMGFEAAIKAIHGVAEWQAGYDRLTFEHAVEQSE